MNDGDGGSSPGGGGGGQAEGEFDVVSEGQHIRTGWTGTKPSLFANEQTGADAPGHGVAAGRQGSGLFEILAYGAKSAG